MTEAEYTALIHKRTLESYQAPPGNKVSKKTSSSGPNKTESEYLLLLQHEYPGCSIAFEGLKLKCANGHTYTPDWIVRAPGGILCVEVKGRGNNGFRHPSYQRARVMFDQCRQEWPFLFRWAEKHKGTWQVNNFSGNVKL